MNCIIITRTQTSGGFVLKHRYQDAGWNLHIHADGGCMLQEVHDSFESDAIPYKNVHDALMVCTRWT